KFLQEYLRAAEGRANGPNVEYELAQVRQAYWTAATEYAGAAQWADAWELLGRWADAREGVSYGYQPTGNLLSLLADHLATLAARLSPLPRVTSGLFSTTNQLRYSTGEQWADLLLARDCLADPSLHGLGERLAGLAGSLLERTEYQSAAHAYLRREVAASTARLAGGAHAAPGAWSRLALWDATAVAPWIAHAGHL